MYELNKMFLRWVDSIYKFHANDEDLNAHYKSTTKVFPILCRELKAMDEWKEQHKEVCSNNQDIRDFTTDMHLTYSFVPTGIGTVFTIECSCGAKEDLTDYGSW